MHPTETSVFVTGLLPGQDYSYRFYGLGGNWPAVVSPVSGTFVANNKSQTLPVVVDFCANTGLCPPSRSDVLSYTLNDRNNEMLTTVLQADVLDICENTTIKSTPAIVTASGFPSLNVIMPSSSLISSDITLISDHYYYFSPLITGMIPGESYTYTINSMGGNWPILCWPTTGTVSSSKGYKAIDIAVSFCPKLSYCLPGTPNLLSNYSLTADYNQTYANKNLFTILNISVQQDNYPFTNAVSDQLSIRCNECLPLPTPSPTATPTPTPTPMPSFNTSLNITNNSILVGSLAGITLAASYLDKLEFNAIADSATPVIMDLYIGAVQVASVTYPGNVYNNKPFSFTLYSTRLKYTGVFKEGSVTLL